MPRQSKHPNRFEFKYLLHHRQARGLLEALDGYVVADPHSDPELGYPIYSIYYDSPTRELFWEKIEGLKYRRKVRFRSYGKSDEIFLEIKQRIDRTVQKRRTRWPKAQVDACFGPDRLDEESAEGLRDPVSDEIFVLWHRHRLQPSLGISYRRRAFLATNESDLRITLDTRVKYHVNDLAVGRPPDEGKYVVNPRLVVLEIKFGQVVPLWLSKIVSRFGLQLTRLSKYCAGIDREYHQGQLTVGEEGKTWTN